jgi:hypothetical protein
MVESGSHVMHNLSGQDTQSRRDLSIRLYQGVPILSIFIGEGRTFSAKGDNRKTANERGDLIGEIADVLIGPF